MKRVAKVRVAKVRVAKVRVAKVRVAKVRVANGGVANGGVASDPLNLVDGVWGLGRARASAALVLGQPRLVRALMRALLSDDAGLRQRAADTARRLVEKRPELLVPEAESVIGAFSECGGDNWRTRAHLGLVAARVAHSRALRLRVAGLLMPLYYDPSNVVRCTAIEGLSVLASREAGLRAQFVAIAEEALVSGTLAMRDRALHGLARVGGRS